MYPKHRCKYRGSSWKSAEPPVDSKGAITPQAEAEAEAAEAAAAEATAQPQATAGARGDAPAAPQRSSATYPKEERTAAVESAAASLDSSNPLAVFKWPWQQVTPPHAYASQDVDPHSPGTQARGRP